MVESSAYEWIGHRIKLRKSLIDYRKRVGDRTESCGTPLLIGLEEEQWPSTTGAIEWSGRKLEMKKQREG